MQYLVFDIETEDEFDRTKTKAEDLTLSVIGVYSYPEKRYEVFTRDELEGLWEMMQKVDTLVGYNSDHFDIPLLDKYTQVNLKKEYKSIDLLASIRDSIGRRVPLDWVAEGTLGVNKGGSGLNAIKWWKQGEYEKVKEYCRKDVEITKRLFDYAQTNEELQFVDFGSLHKIPIDTSAWKKEETVESISISLF